LTTFLAGSKVCCGHLRDCKYGRAYFHPGTGPSSKGPTGADSAVTGTATETNQ